MVVCESGDRVALPGEKGKVDLCMLRIFFLVYACTRAWSSRKCGFWKGFCCTMRLQSADLLLFGCYLQNLDLSVDLSAASAAEEE